MNIKKITDQLIEHEKLSLKPYKCPAGKLTIGVGRNIEDNGISEDEAEYLLKNDILRCRAELFEIFDQFNTLPENIQLVLIDMNFNLGITRFKKFKEMINAVYLEDWPEMAYQMKDSRWFVQVGTRAINLIQMVNDVK